MNLNAHLQTFLDRCDTAASKLGIARATLSTKLFNDGKRLDQIASGDSDVGVRRLAEADRALDDLLAARAEATQAAA